MSEDYYRLLSADSLIKIITRVRKEHPDMSYRKLCTLIGLPANRGANLSYFINGRTSDPTLKSLKRYTEMTHELQKFYVNTTELNEYINILKPEKWRDYWIELHGTPVDFDEFSKESDISYQSIHNYVGKKRLAIYPRYMTAVAFTAYTKYRAQQMEEIAKYRRQETVNFNPLGKKLQDIEKAKEDFWRFKNGA